MPVPGSVRQSQLQVRRFRGASGRGRTYAAAVPLWGQVRYTNRLLRQPDGDEHVVSVMVLVGHDAAVPVGSLLEVRPGEWLTVREVREVPMAHRTSHLELWAGV